MPLSEFYQASVRGKFDSAQSKMASSSSNLSSFVPDNEFVELLWENGPVVMQGKSNRPRKTSIATTNFFSPLERVEGKDSTDINSMPKVGRLEATDSFVSEFSPSDPSGNDRMNTQYGNMVHWINYPVEDPVANDYCSDLFSEFSGVTMPANGNNAFGHSTKDSPNVEHGSVSKALADESDPSRTGTSQMYRSLQGQQSSFSRMEDLGTRDCNNAQQGISRDLLGARLLKQDLTTSKPHKVGISMPSVNFSHFSRPAMQAKANLQSVDRLRSNENSAAAPSSNHNESTPIHSSGGLQSTSGTSGQLGTVSSMLEMGSSAKTPLVSVEQLDAVCEDDMSRKNLNDEIPNSNMRSPDRMNNHQTSDLAAGTSLRRSGIEKNLEPILATSSVCSGNTAGATSDDPKLNAKRKIQEEESGNHIEDIEDASVGIKRPSAVKGRNAKRSRAAEVHNLLERRRRDRINEKMRALQELIPNCSKVDKASMLDEAIEYLKTLQLQVQMMSMGSGLCMPPMMLPTGMQHMHALPIADFSQMGVGMGMNMRFNYGMGMVDISGSSGCPLIPAPPMHGTQFPCSAVQGPQGLYGMPRPTNLPIFAQGLPMSVPHIPPLTSTSSISTNLNSVPKALTTATMQTNPLQAPDTAPSSISKDQKEKRPKLELLQRTSPSDSQETKESSQQSLSNQASSTSETGMIN